MRRPLARLLVANRGEIAVRIMATARRMGIATVAVHSDADARARHLAEADEAVRLGPPPAAESYLKVAAIIAAARATGADAVHPGYGFLAENADFAEAVAAAGLIFVGPPAGAIRAMGSKAGARELMQRAGLPVVPGYQGEDQSDAALAAAAAEIGFPVLLKASAGGGGKGMKVAASAAEFPAALASARREARASFGDARMIVERYLARGRHVEVQVFADAAGGIVHLFDRDCSIQRRHQKLVEEAPAPGLAPLLAGAMREAAVTAARAVGYVGAGTVEFLLAGDSFFFMEMNTRLQVEHPVTEAITGLDLVEWQLRVARGEPLPLRQEEIAARGHAVEARLCAEDPEIGFLPQAGRLDHLALPGHLAGVRVDSGVRAGDEVSSFYDPMIAKLVAHGADRAEAVARLAAALAATEVAGPATNRAFLARTIAHPAFAAGEVDTGFVERHGDALLCPRPSAARGREPTTGDGAPGRGFPSQAAQPRAGGSDPPDAGEGDLPDAAPDPAELPLLALAAFAALRSAESAAARIDPADPFSPWGLADGFRLAGQAGTRLELRRGGELFGLDVLRRGGGYELDLGGGPVFLAGSLDAAGAAELDLGGRRLKGRAIVRGARITVFCGGAEARFEHIDPLAPPASRGAAAGHLAAPMPGKVVAVEVAAGDAVARGATLVVVEAMKMEHAVTAPRDGRVRSVAVGVGDQVAAGQELVAMEEGA